MASYGKTFFIFAATLLSLTACSPSWYVSGNNSMLAYGPRDLVWNMAVAAPEMAETSQQLVLSVMIANLAALDGNSDEVNARILAIPATELRKISSCLEKSTTSFYYHERRQRAAARLSWSKDFSCQPTAIARRDLLAILPGQFGLPAMPEGHMDLQGLKILFQDILQLPPPVDKVVLSPLASPGELLVSQQEISDYLTFIFNRMNIEVLDQNQAEASTMQCQLSAQKLDPHSFHRMIYHLNCHIVEPAGAVVWQQTASLIPLLP